MIERVKTFEKILIFSEYSWIFSNKTIFKLVFRSYFFGATPHKDILRIIRFLAFFCVEWAIWLRLGELGETLFARKTTENPNFTEVKIAWVRSNQLIYRSNRIQIDRTTKSSIWVNFRDKPPTHMRATHAIINFEKFSKIALPWNRTRIFISLDSAANTESFDMPISRNRIFHKNLASRNST